MSIRFVHEWPLEATMIFDEQYEPALQMEVEEKRDLLRRAIAVWMLYDGELAGEIYGLSTAQYLDEYGEPLDDTNEGDTSSLYVFSTTVLPRFEGRGLAKIMKAYFMGVARASGYRSILGHATSPAMVRINAEFGALFGAVHEGWYGTERAAHFYRIEL